MQWDVVTDATLCASAYIVKAHAHSDSSQHSLMKIAARDVLVANITQLACYMAESDRDWLRRGEPNQSRIGKESGIHQTSVGRILRKEQNPSIDQVEAIARCFGLQSWQIMVPNLDPRNPPVYVMTEAEKAFYAKMRDLHRLINEPPATYG